MTNPKKILVASMHRFIQNLFPEDAKIKIRKIIQNKSNLKHFKQEKINCPGNMHSVLNTREE